MSKFVVALLAILLSGPAAAQCDVARDLPPVCNLQPGAYSPMADAKTYTPPSCNTDDPASDEERELIAAAISRAPSDIQDDLCSVTTIFINTDQSLGVLEEEYQGNGSYISLSQRTIAGGFGIKLEDEEDLIQNEVRKAYKNNVTLDHDVWGDSRKLGVLAVMAHEMAHILWFSKNVRAKSCFQSAFINTSWVKNDRFDPWIDFAEDTMNEHKGTNDHPRRGDNLSPGQVKRIYGRFASLFAAVSPVEDFVETYKLSAFIDGVTRFRVEIDPSSQEVDIKASSAQEPLAGKLRCVRSF